METRVYRNPLPARAARALALLVLSDLPAGALLAQGEDAETLTDVKACVAIEGDGARLACYDGALGRGPSPQGTQALGPSTAALPDAAPATAAATAGVVAATAPPPATSTAPLQAAPGLQTIVVTELRLRTPSSAVFVTATGQVWEQADTGRGRYPETPFEAKLEPGSLGSMFLISPEGGPRIRVRRRD